MSTATLTRHVDGDARLEDIGWMATTDEHLTGAALRLGLTTEALARFLYRRGRRDLYAKLAARDPHINH
jgi:hypothetical protein